MLSLQKRQAISIHSLRVEWDCYIRNACEVRYSYFNPLTPCGVRPVEDVFWFGSTLFQSTHSVWSETLPLWLLAWRSTNFNPLTPCGVRLDAEMDNHSIEIFQSTHSVWSETDIFILNRTPRIGFQSTHSVWSETFIDFEKANGSRNFNPLTPCGVRRKRKIKLMFSKDFNPLTPCGVRLDKTTQANNKGQISIHSLRVEWDVGCRQNNDATVAHFDPLRVEWDCKNSLCAENFCFKRALIFRQAQCFIRMSIGRRIYWSENYSVSIKSMVRTSQIFYDCLWFALRNLLINMKQCYIVILTFIGEK